MTKTKATKDQQIRYLLVSETREGEYFHVRARVTTDRYENGSRYPYGLDDDYSDGLLYSGLRVSCQGDTNSRAREYEPVYGFTVEYRDVFAVDARKARRMTKTLDKLEKGLARLSEMRGYVQTYGEYCGRVAEVLGCIGIAYDMPRDRYASDRWTWLSVGDGINRINHRISMWQREGKEPQTQTEQDQEQSA
jgi:hypothetical protein